MRVRATRTLVISALVCQGICRNRGSQRVNTESSGSRKLFKDPQFAAEYLNAVLEDGEQEEVMVALRRLSKAFGGVQKLAEDAELNATTLYHTLSSKGNPALKSLTALLRAMGLQLAVRPLPEKRLT